MIGNTNSGYGKRKNHRMLPLRFEQRPHVSLSSAPPSPLLIANIDVKGCGGEVMDGKHLLAYSAGTVDQEFVPNVRKRGKALLGALIELVVSENPRNPIRESPMLPPPTLCDLPESRV